VRNQPMKLPAKKTILLLTVLLLSLSLLTYFWLIPSPVLVDIAQVERGPFRETLNSDGLLRAQQRWTVLAPADGDLEQISWKTGESIQQGQIVCTLLWDDRKWVIHSPASGSISHIFRDTPGPVRRSDPLMEIINPDKLEVVAELLTTDAVRIPANAPIFITGWGGTGSLEARVSRISRAGFTKPSSLGVDEERTELVASILEAPQNILAKIGDQFHIEMTILIAEHPAALSVPVGALLKSADQWYVYRVIDGHAQKIIVEWSTRNSERALITRGLREGDEVVVYPGDLVIEGTRVRPEPR